MPEDREVRLFPFRDTVDCHSLLGQRVDKLLVFSAERQVLDQMRESALLRRFVAPPGIEGQRSGKGPSPGAISIQHT